MTKDEEQALDSLYVFAAEHALCGFVEPWLEGRGPETATITARCLKCEAVRSVSVSKQAIAERVKARAQRRAPLPHRPGDEIKN
jgi:hypothetical protein